MPRRPATVTQAEIARALRAMAQEGLRAGVEFRPDGTVAVVPMNGNAIEESRGICAKPAEVEKEREIIL